MSAEVAYSKSRVDDFAALVRDQLVSVNNQFSYVCIPSMPEEDVRQYVHEPLAALPEAICRQIPHLTIVLVPYIERTNGKGPLRVSFDAPLPSIQVRAASTANKFGVTLLFGIKDEEVSEFHYSLYGEIAGLVASVWSPAMRDAFNGLIRGELAAKINGEIDEKSWHLKQELLRRPASRDVKPFREYAKQAFEDTLTLYLHGICCDIDVETGPRQMPSRYVRKRLELLHSFFPPPSGHAVFPEELNRLPAR